MEDHKRKMIVSASYKTDIPAFYHEWFLNRLRAGFCRMMNPFNRAQCYKVSLQHEEVDGFVFWTKNVTPFLPALAEVNRRGFPFVVQYTINAYPRELERRVVDAEQSIRNMHTIAQTYGAKVAVWRYDTVIFSSITDYSFHRANFQRLAAMLDGATDEVVVSFVQLYRKTVRNLNEAGKRFKFTWFEPGDGVKRSLLAEFAETASAHGMKVTICAQPELLIDGIEEARCIDAERLSKVGSREIVARLGGGRAQCGCYSAKDIGEYDTCPHGCVYCYAVRERTLALQRYKSHDPCGEYLFQPHGAEPLQLELL